MSVIWKPNYTWMNRWRQRIGIGIDTSEAHKIREELQKLTPEEKDHIEREIEVRTTEEKVKQMHEIIVKMQEEMSNSNVTHL